MLKVGEGIGVDQAVPSGSMREIRLLYCLWPATCGVYSELLPTITTVTLMKIKKDHSFQMKLERS
jgi:hypothetical protein